MLFVAVKRVKCLLLVVVICRGLKMTSRTFLVIHVLHGKGKYRLEKDLFSPFFMVAALCKLYPGKQTFITINCIDVIYHLLDFC